MCIVNMHIYTHEHGYLASGLLERELQVGAGNKTGGCLGSIRIVCAL